MDTRNADHIVQQRELFDRLARQLNTCMPGQVQSFDPATQTVTVTPALMMKTYIEGTLNEVQLPDIENVPVFSLFSSIGGFAVTVPVNPGDPCLILWSQRAIDNWWTEGGIQPTEPNAISCRHHDMSDAFVLVGVPSLKDLLPNYRTDGIELRDRTGHKRCTIYADKVLIGDDAGAHMTFEADGKIHCWSDVVIESGFRLTGSVNP